MKKIFMLLGVLLCGAAVSVFARESVLIDFSLLVDDFDGYNKMTMMDVSSASGTVYTEEERAMMKVSLNAPEWVVELSSSSQTNLNNSLSYVRPVTLKDTATRYPGEQVLGMRVHFPDPSFNGYAYIKPPFSIPMYSTSAFEDDPAEGDQFVGGYGVVKNVGTIKSITVTAVGRQFPYGFGVILRDRDNNKRMIMIDNLEFAGWRDLTWVNPNYVVDVRQRELKMQPLYPKELPAIALESLVVYRDAMKEGGDFTSYVKDVKITHDLAVREAIDPDVDDEAIWGIQRKRGEKRKVAEFKNFGQTQILRFLEQQKMDEGEAEAASASTAPPEVAPAPAEQ